VSNPRTPREFLSPTARCHEQIEKPAADKSRANSTGHLDVLTIRIRKRVCRQGHFGLQDMVIFTSLDRPRDDSDDLQVLSQFTRGQHRDVFRRPSHDTICSVPLAQTPFLIDRSVLLPSGPVLGVDLLSVLMT
jgi:hypothetical protein